MFPILIKLGWFFKLYWRRYTLAVVALIIAGTLEVIPPKLVGDAIDEIHLGTLTGERLYSLLALYGGLAIVIYVVTYYWMYQLFGGAFLVERLLRKRFMKHLLQMTPTFYERNRTGDLMARATNDLKAVSITAGFGILTLVDSTAWMVTLLLTMGLLISWKLTLAAMLPLPFIALTMRVYGRTIHERFTKAQDAFGQLNDQVLETISGVRVIRAYVQEKADGERFKQATEDVYRKNVEVARMDALFDPTIKILVGISYLIGLGFGATLVFQNELTLGELVSFNVYLGMLIWPMFAIGQLINIMQRGSASLDRVNETLAYKPDVLNPPHPVVLAMPETISFDHVTFRYPSSASDNLKEVSFSLKKGQTLGIVGRTGSGKTTLFKQLLREYPKGSKGAITISGIPLEQMAMEQIHGWIGYVPQDAMLFSKSVRDNILFGQLEATEAELAEALADASFQSDLQVLADGLETLVGEKGVALSGGQKQRISLARAFIADPEILLLDDAMSAVDAKTEAAILSNIMRKRRGKTTLISTHRLSAVRHADWILVLDQGRITEEGTHDQLMQRKGWYREQVERQQVEAILTESG